VVHFFGQTMKKFAKNPLLLMTLFYAAIVFAFFWQEVIMRTSGNHAFNSRPFTPITVSDDLLWWQPPGILLIMAGLFVLLRKSLQWSRKYALLVATLWTLPLPTLHVCFHFYTPEPYIFVPQLSYWGWDFQTIGREFVRENSIIFLVFAAYPILLLWLNRSSCEKHGQFCYWAWSAVLPFCFLLCLSPFLTQRVYVYGSIGHRVDQRCLWQLAEIHIALLRYAADHDNRLPVAEDYQMLLPQIKSYLNLPETATSIWKPGSDSCIIGNALDRPPMPFLWNASLSGKEVVRDKSWDEYEWTLGHEQPDSKIPAFYDSGRCFSVAGKNWVECPYALSRRGRRPWIPVSLSLSAKDVPFDKFRVINDCRTEELER
jgi:hypothetical protein